MHGGVLATRTVCQAFLIWEPVCSLLFQTVSHLVVERMYNGTQWRVTKDWDEKNKMSTAETVIFTTSLMFLELCNSHDAGAARGTS